MREAIFGKFLELDIKFGIGIASAHEVDVYNVRQASLLAMRRAVCAFGSGATYALVDAWKIPGIKILQRGIIHGDRLVKSIAAASIIAKVCRDRLMMDYDREFPGYGLAQHKGYGTAYHKAALRKLGLSTIHRKSFCRN